MSGDNGKITLSVNAPRQRILGGVEAVPGLRLSLDSGGTAALDAVTIFGSDHGAPFDVLNGVVIQWGAALGNPCPEVAIAFPVQGAMEALALELAPLLERVHAGHRIDANEHGRFGELNEDALEAQAEVESLLDDRVEGCFSGELEYIDLDAEAYDLDDVCFIGAGITLTPRRAAALSEDEIRDLAEKVEQAGWQDGFPVYAPRDAIELLQDRGERLLDGELDEVT